MGPAVHAPNSLLPRGMTRKPQNGYSFAGCVAPLHAPSHAEPRRPMGRLAVIWYTYLTPESCWPLLSPLCNTSDCYGALKEALMRQASPYAAHLETTEWPSKVSPFNVVGCYVDGHQKSD